MIYTTVVSGVNEPERRSGTCYLAGTRVPVLIDKLAGTLSTYSSGTYLQWTKMNYEFMTPRCFT